MMAWILQMAQTASGPIGPQWLGIVLPGGLLIISFIVTYLLYKHFSKH